jgi:acetolactate decarboxylase
VIPSDRLRFRGIAVLLVMGCACPRKDHAPTVFLPQVRTWGTLREGIHEGQVGPKVTLSDVLGPGLYAVGAVTGLAGEITVVNGVAYSAVTVDDGIRVAPMPEVTAAILVAAIVPGWMPTPVAAAADAAALDDRIESAAQAAGLDVDQPFPFIVEGTINATWHVLRSQGNPSSGTHADHLRNATTGKLTEAPAVLIGFFSRHHQGVFTHMGQRTHIHVITPDRRTMGHVDEVSLPREATLKLPAR